jgi:hypothetical protein
MITSLELQNYRGFRRYHLSKLTRVNLLVGRNNCGKSSVLEGVYLLASTGNPAVLASIASQRGEMVLVGDQEDAYRRRAYPVVSHFFFGHDLAPDVCFEVRTGDGLGSVKVSIVAPGASPQATLFDEGDALASTFGLRLKWDTPTGVTETPEFAVSEEGILAREDLIRHLRQARRERGAPLQFIAPDSLEPGSMGEMWDNVIRQGRESEVIEAMRILEPDLENLFFLSSEVGYRFGGRAGVLVAFRGKQERIPLGSYGDGMRRMLALSLSLIRSAGGFLLVDEIDTGLHYSVMADMWRLVVEAARRANVQVFATTHSSDCVRGLGWLCENHPELQQEVSLHKMTPELDEPVALEARQIVLAVNQGLEVR